MSTELIQSLTTAELSFAQQLASGETTVRRKAMIKLGKWFKSTLKQSEMSSDDFMRLWKGLYYCMWMQDKLLLQEELCDTICSLLPQCGSLEKCLLFQETCYQTLAVEWPNIDKFRLDKFMMVARRILRVTLSYVRDEHKWSAKVLTALIASWQKTVITPSTTVPASLKYHFASIFLDELDLAHSQGMSLKKAQTTKMLTPFVELFANKSTTEQYIATLCGEIFDTMLMPLAAGHHLPMEQDESDESGNESTSGDAIVKGKQVDDEQLQFDYAGLGALLFTIGKSSTITANRRRKIYDLVAKLESAANGKDPFKKTQDELLDEDQEGYDEDDEIDRAATRLLRREEMARILMEKGTHPLAKAKRQTKVVKNDQGDGDSDSSDDIVERGENDIELSDSETNSDDEELPAVLRKELSKKGGKALKKGKKTMKPKKTITKAKSPKSKGPKSGLTKPKPKYVSKKKGKGKK